MLFNILLGSTSSIKKEGVEKGFGCLLSNIDAVDAMSGVPSQPIGKYQTQRGAFNRAMNAIPSKTLITYSYSIGIENGIWSNDDSYTNNSWVDAACICAIPYGWSGTFNDARDTLSPVVFVWSDILLLPDSFESGPDGEWSALKDPHIIVTNGSMSRSQFLENTIRHKLIALLKL
jgi:hypothetical protein